MADSKLQLTSLDFDSIKKSLKAFLKDQQEFQDYDFEGSAINILLDILAYNTFYNGYYMNMVANEMFLDTAVLRKTVVSHAKLLGYTPKSATAAKALINVSITKSNTDPTTLLNIPRFTQFTTQTMDGGSYTFYTTDDSEYVANVGQTFTFTNLTIKEGQPVTKAYSVDNTTNPQQMFNLTDLNIDTSTLMVSVQTSPTNPSYNVFTLAEDATEVSTNSNIYYLEEAQNGSYQIYFGDGIVGKKLDDQNIITVSYLVTSGSSANRISNFKLQSYIIPSSQTTTTLSDPNQPSNGGSEIEDVASIKLIAPKSFIAQNRVVTKNDYIALINKKYPYFDAVSVWGGEEESPPVYGKVFISAKPKQNFEVTVSEQQHLIKDILKPISILTVTPEYVPAEYDYLNIILNVVYDPKATTYTTEQLKTAIRGSVNNFVALNLNSFNTKFKFSKFLKAVDSTDQSIQSTSADFYIEKKFKPETGISRSYQLKYGTELHRGISSDRLYSSPAITMSDSEGNEQKCFLEETPFSFGGIDEILINDTGSNYSSAPTITIVGDGKGANAYAKIVNGKIDQVIIDKRGEQYTTAIATVSGGGGFGGNVTPILAGKNGTLRSYYFDDTNVKRVLNENAGRIDYVNGVVYIDNLYPISIDDPYGSLSIFVRPANYSFETTKNLIITHDPNDQDSLQINLKPV